jgi:hypothetical protein
VKIAGVTPPICEDIQRVETLQPGGVSADMTGQGRSRAQVQGIYCKGTGLPELQKLPFVLTKREGWVYMFPFKIDGRPM